MLTPLEKKLVEECLYIKSSPLGKKSLMLDMWTIANNYDLFSFVCKSFSELCQKYIKKIDAIAFFENCGQVLGSMLACDLGKPILCITEKDKPGFRPEKVDLSTHGRNNLLIVDAMIQSGVHLDKAVKRINRRGGHPVAILVVVDNDLAAGERVLQTGNELPLESMFKLSKMRDDIVRVHGEFWRGVGASH
jgi:orotate phosphoribosyltransferase